MGYNEDLEDRIDRVVDRFGDIAKKKMFGGVCYLFNGNMCFGIHKEYLMLRVSPEKAEELMTSEYFIPFNITGKPMKGWVLVSPDVLETEDQLVEMLRLGIDFVKTLPKKEKRREAYMITKTVRQSATFTTSPHKVYEVLIDSKKHSQLTGSEVQIERKTGSKFSVYGGDIQGVNLELVPNQKIVQSWRYSDWPKGHYSKATFLLKQVPGGTRLTLTQTGVPEEFFEDIKQGWKDYYWQPMKEMFEKSK